MCCCYQKDKRAKRGNHETKQCSFERIKRTDGGCLCFECNSCVDQKICGALNTTQQYFDSLQPTVQKLQRSTLFRSYEHGNNSNLPGCFWKYSGYGDRAQTVLDRENKVRERSQVLPGKSCLRSRSVLKHKTSLNKKCIIWFGKHLHFICHYGKFFL